MNSGNINSEATFAVPRPPPPRPPTSTATAARGLDPLQIPEVLEHIFEFCRFQDLNACRQVSRMWHGTAQKAWISSSKVTLTPQVQGSNMSSFLRFIREKKTSFSRKPYTNYCLHGSISSSLQLWKLCGTHITYLELNRCTFSSVDELRKVLYKSCPNMEHLTVLDVTVKGLRASTTLEPSQWIEPKFGVNGNLKILRIQRATIQLGVSRMELLSHYPNVQSLTLEGPGDGNEPWFRSIEIIRQRDPSNLKLKVFNSMKDESIPDPLARVLSASNTCLEALTLQVDGSDAEGKLREIILSNAKTLKRMELSRESPFTSLNTFTAFSLSVNLQLEKLTVISLKSRVFVSLEFLKTTPNLKKFAFQSINELSRLASVFETTDWTEMEGVTLPKCKDVMLRTDPFTTERSVTGFGSLMSCFPGVETLYLEHANNSMFASVCEHCPNLRHLKISKSTVDDCGMSGLVPEDVKRINDEHDMCKPTAVPRANITCLRRLESLFMINDPPNPRVPTSIGYAAAFGFQQLRLRKLDLRKYKVEFEAQEVFYKHVKICNVFCVCRRLFIVYECTC